MTLSVSGKEWRLPPEIQVDGRLQEAANGSILLAKLLIRRGVKTADDAFKFLDPAGYISSGPMEFADMSQAIVRVSKAIAQRERVTIYGDYDVDGVTGTSVLLSVLRQLGASVDYYIPNRINEGYGLNLKAISILASKHQSKLIITCDCGISNFAEVNFARSLGLDTIILDHHSMPDLLPPAVAILHPKQLSPEHPLYHLPGVGVAYKFCEALLMDRGMAEQACQLLDFVTLGMIADMVPLVKENRYLVQIGLPKLMESSRPGISALLSQVQNAGGTDIVGFGLAPRINAVGRLSDACLAVELMTTEDNDKARALAKQLQLENARRQELCDQIMFEADQVMTAEKNPEVDKAIVIYKAGWHHGVVGIVASRLVEKYHLPVFIGELDKHENVIKGSARGIEGIDLYEVLKANEHLMLKWGGHKMAAGFSLEADKGEAFSRAIAQTCQRMLGEKTLKPVLDVDAIVEPQDVSIDLAKLLTKLAPFGMANKKPTLVMRNLQCESIRSLGKEGKHSKIILVDRAGQRNFESVLWNSRGKVPNSGQFMDVAFMPEVNEYNGRSRLQLVIADWRNTSAKQENSPSLALSVSSSSMCVTTEVADSQMMQGTAGKTQANYQGLNIRQDDVLKSVTSESTQSGKKVGTDSRVATFKAISQVWKDLRQHEDPQAILEAATRKLGAKLAVFAESATKVSGTTFVDRTIVPSCEHLLVWEFPPSIKLFQAVMASCGAQNIYLVGGAEFPVEAPASFLSRLMGLVRFAVNRRGGQVEGEKLAAALGTTKMAVALGLTILRKLNVVDWFAEDGLIYLDMLDQKTGKAEDLPEFRQLGNSLKEIAEFRGWCATSPLKAIQLSVAPNQVALVDGAEQARRNDEPYQSQDATTTRGKDCT